jgi:DNA-binding LacI/PurR family transcriptional regulator
MGVGTSRRPTLADVARRAGVSVSTASRALNGRGGPSPETRALVMATAASMQFRPSGLARSLRTRKTSTVGFVVPDISSSFYSAVLLSAQQTLEESGYRVMLMNSERDVAEEAEALRTLLNHPVDGLLVATTGLDADEFESVAGDEVPCVFFDGIPAGAGVGSVTVMNEEGMHILVDHLVEHGHRRIALLAGAQTETSGIERLRGFEAALDRHAIDVPEEYVLGCDWTQESGRLQTLELLRLSMPPTAVVGASEDLALGALAACRETGLSLPEELAIVSFDDPYFGALLEPSLTALTSRPGDIGRLAASQLIGSLQNTSSERRDIRLPVELVRRRSCGCHSAAGLRNALPRS